MRAGRTSSAKLLREQRHLCGREYMEVDLFPITPAEHSAGRAAKHRRASTLVQENANEKRSRRHLHQLLLTNFDRRDLHALLTFDNAHLPASRAEAWGHFSLMMRRLRRACKAAGLAQPKWICVLEQKGGNGEGSAPRKGRKPGPPQGRFHFHLICSGDIDRDLLESMWRTPGRQRDSEPLGLVRSERLQPATDHLAGLARYITKEQQGKHRWAQSSNLEQPRRPAPNDGRYTRRGLARLVRSGEVSARDFWERQYPGWEFIDAEWFYNEVTSSFSAYGRLRRKRVRAAGHMQEEVE